MSGTGHGKMTGMTFEVRSFMLVAGVVGVGVIVNAGGCGQRAPEPRVAAAPAVMHNAPAPVAPVQEEAWSVKRIGGDMEAVVSRVGENYFFGRCAITTPLPEGYPPPTPPGAVELKKYPAVRRAEVSGSVTPDLGMNVGFFPLFNHIQRRDIEMTSPVEMDYRDGASTEGQEGPTWTMSFLYRSADLGPTGKDGRVEVVDAAPVVVVAMGLQGWYTRQRIEEAAQKLREMLEEQGEWEVAGPVRALYYNGPEKPPADKWAEAQIPVRKKGGAN
jgi:hypothetical protein